jgi:hypothetical protein
MRMVQNQMTLRRWLNTYGEEAIRSEEFELATGALTYFYNGDHYPDGRPGADPKYLSCWEWQRQGPIKKVNWFVAVLIIDAEREARRRTKLTLQH